MFHRLFRVYRAAYSGLPAEVWWLSGVLLISRAGTMVAPFLSLYLTQELLLTKVGTGVLIGCYGAGGAVGALLGPNKLRGQRLQPPTPPQQRP